CFVYRDILKDYAAAGGGALAEGIPVIHNRYAGGIAANPDLYGVARFVQGPQGYPVSEEGAGGIKTGTVQAQPFGGAHYMGGGLGNETCPGLALGTGIPDPVTVQYIGEPAGLLLRRTGFAEQLQNGNMVLRDLPQRRIRLADNGKDPSKRKIGDIGPAKARRYRDASQAA